MELHRQSRSPFRTPTGPEVYRWPEFVALAKRLGVPLDLPTTKIVIELKVDEEVPVEIAHSYRAVQPADTRPEYHPPYLRPMTATEACRARATYDSAVDEVKKRQAVS